MTSWRHRLPSAVRRTPDRGGARWVRPRTVALLAAVTLALPLGVTTYDPAAYLATSSMLLAVQLAVTLSVRWEEPPVTTYTRALAHAAALHVHLRHVRVAALHDVRGLTLVTVTWRAATTVALDADGRPLASLARNGLVDGYTLTLPFADADVARLLAADARGGDLSVYATTDLATNPDANVLDHGLHLDQYDVEFASWSGSISLSRSLSDW